MLQYLDMRAIGWGVLANIGFSLGLGILATLFAMLVLSAQGMTADDLDRLLGHPWQSPGLALFYLLVGAAGDYGTGMVTARMATRLEYYQACAVMLCMTLVAVGLGRGDLPLAYLSASVALGFAAACLGVRGVKLRKLSGR